MNFSRQRRAAFTLIEMMMAITIFALVMSAIYSTWYLIVHATEVGEKAAVQSQRARIALHTIEDSLTSVQSFQASMKYYYFVAENGDQPILSYTAHVPDWFPRNSRFNTNLRRLTFTLEGGNQGEHNLVLRQNPILMDMDPDEKTTPLVLATDVDKFEVECWDAQQMQWVDDWVTTNSIPALIRLSLRFGGHTDSGNKVPVLDCVRLISLPSITLPGIIQNGRPGAGGAPGQQPPPQAGGQQIPGQFQRGTPQ
jgi:type II secretion system protein J